MSTAGDRSARRSTTAANSWHTNLAKARQHLERHGTLNRAGSTTRDWVDQAIRMLRDGTATETQAAQLTDAGITADTPTTAEHRRTQTWETFLRELDWWITRHGDAQVPQMARTRKIDGVPYWLGKRVSQYRIAYGKGTLPTETIAALEQRPGWSWRVMEDRWDQQWHTNADHVRRHIAGGGTVSTLKDLDRNLYEWLLRQRRALTDLPADRRTLLEQIPGALQPADRRVHHFTDAAQQWLQQNPELTLAALRYNTTLTTTDGDTYPLGKRATYYRRRYHQLEKAHDLRPDEIHAIEQLPGWHWNLNDKYRRRGQVAT